MLETVNARYTDDTKCAVWISVEFRSGMSPNHASKIKFSLTDRARKRANDATDDAYQKGFADELTKGKGAAPKL